MFNLNDYETVEERLVKFWKDHPDGQIHTRLLESTTTRFIVEASIFRTEADPRPWTTGLAEETVQGRGVNATSALENCETSAIGRALANAGYATKGKRASREEMGKVAKGIEKENLIEETKKKMAETAANPSAPVANSADDPWTVYAPSPTVTMDEAVKTVEKIIGTQDKVIPNCKGCHNNKPMEWHSGMGKNGKPYGKFSCWTCKEVIWYKIAPDGTWIPQ